jgi:hypothetical protein
VDNWNSSRGNLSFASFRKEEEIDTRTTPTGANRTKANGVNQFLVIRKTQSFVGLGFLIFWFNFDRIKE